MKTKSQKIINGNFRSVLYASKNSDKAMIIVTGSDGGIKWAKEIAKVFCDIGISCLAVAYWKENNLPKSLSLIPIEIIAIAADYLKDKGYTKIGIYGFSKGAELALLSASYFPQISFVIAVSPACCVFEGIRKQKYSKTSSWTYKGEPLPFVSFEGIKTSFIKNLIKYREVGFARQYCTALSKNKNEDNTIKVENINAPILLISAENDAQWCSKLMAELIVKRLQNCHFAFDYRHEIYCTASHILCPVKTKLRYAYRIERKHGKKCNFARKKALKLTLDWLLNLDLA